MSKPSRKLFLRPMIYHFVVGDNAGDALAAAVASGGGVEGEVIPLKDILHVGPLKKEEGQSFSDLRSAFWQQVVVNEKHPIQVDDMERLLSVSGKMYKDDSIQAWFWMAPAAADVCAYYWVLPYLSKHIGRFFIVNIAGLPFLDESGKLFYPKSISTILPRELVKARKLARLVTPSEMEIDTDEWARLVEENAAVRAHEAGKKIISQELDVYDVPLMSFCSQQFQKASKIVRQTMNKYNVPTGDLWLAWRLRSLVAEGKLLAQGDVARALNEFDLRLPGEIATIEKTETTPTL